MSAREPLDPTRHFDIAPDGAWEDVEGQYRRLVRRWHPDRHPDATRAEAQAEFIEIVAAFKRLRRHYGEHGHLPKVDPPRPEPRPTVVGHDASGRSARRPPSPGTLRLRAVLRSPLTAMLVALALALALGALVLFLDAQLERERRERALTRAAGSGERTDH